MGLLVDEEQKRRVRPWERWVSVVWYGRAVACLRFHRHMRRRSEEDGSAKETRRLGTPAVPAQPPQSATAICKRPLARDFPDSKCLVGEGFKNDNVLTVTNDLTTPTADAALGSKFAAGLATSRKRLRPFTSALTFFIPFRKLDFC